MPSLQPERNRSWATRRMHVECRTEPTAACCFKSNAGLSTVNQVAVDQPSLETILQVALILRSLQTDLQEAAEHLLAGLVSPMVLCAWCSKA